MARLAAAWTQVYAGGAYKSLSYSHGKLNTTICGLIILECLAPFYKILLNSIISLKKKVLPKCGSNALLIMSHQNPKW